MAAPEAEIMEYTLASDTQRIKFMREAASVRRCHTVMHQDPAYNIGLHSFNMLAMLRILRPEASIDLVWAIIEHDLPERLTGDFPAPVKWTGVVDSHELGELESDIIKALSLSDSVAYLSEVDARWLRGLDMLELYLWSLDQINLGNRNLYVMKNRIEKYLKKNPLLMPKEIQYIIQIAAGMDWIMVPDLGDQQ